MLLAIPLKSTTIFGVTSDLMRRNYSKQRKKIAAKLKNSRIMQITFHTFRHWMATSEFHKSHNIIDVQRILGHKSLLNTQLYTHLVDCSNDEFTAKIAHNKQEGIELAEAGFDYVCNFGDDKLFRKRK